jgi:hypothetical protein
MSHPTWWCLHLPVLALALATREVLYSCLVLSAWCRGCLVVLVVCIPGVRALHVAPSSVLLLASRQVSSVHVELVKDVIRPLGARRCCTGLYFLQAAGQSGQPLVAGSLPARCL